MKTWRFFSFLYRKDDAVVSMKKCRKVVRQLRFKILKLRYWGIALYWVRFPPTPRWSWTRWIGRSWCIRSFLEGRIYVFCSFNLRLYARRCANVRRNASFACFLISFKDILWEGKSKVLLGPEIFFELEDGRRMNEGKDSFI